MMALLYGRTPHLYYRTLNARLVPQLPLSLRHAGCRATYIATTALAWERMEDYLDQRAFDQLLVHDDGTEWWNRDLEALADIGRLVNGSGPASRGGEEAVGDEQDEPLPHGCGSSATLADSRGASRRPQLIVAFLMATHFPYAYPEDRQIYQPVCTTEQMYGPNTEARRPEILNRYKNAADFDDEQVAALLGTLDLKRNLVIVTGDHGESFWEDGALAHCSKLSEIQTRVPLVMAGPGVPAGRIETPTAHADVLPTILHVLAHHAVAVAHCPGRDLLALPAGMIVPTGGQGAAGAEAEASVDASAADQFSLVVPKPVATDPYLDVQVVRPEGKLLLRLALHEPKLLVLGFCDSSGAIDPALTPAPAAAPRWAATAGRALEQLAQ
jgi:hypothetical protein